MARNKSTTQQNKKDALASYIEYGTITAACRDVNIDRGTWYLWKKNDPEFKALVEQSMESVGDDLEQEAIRRAKDGSDTLLIFLLKGHKPDKYKERREQTNVNANFTAADREGACLYELPVAEYVERKQAGTLPPIPEVPGPRVH